MMARRSPILGTTTPVRPPMTITVMMPTKVSDHADLGRAPAELVLRVEHPHRGQRVVRHLVEEHREQQPRHHGQMGQAPEGAEWIGARPFELAAPLGRQRLGQHEEAEDHVGQRQRGGDEERRARIEVLGHEAADDRPEREAGTPGGADEAEIPGAIFVVADVADVSRPPRRTRRRTRPPRRGRRTATSSRWPCRSAGSPRRTRPATTTTPAGARCGR